MSQRGFEKALDDLTVMVLISEKGTEKARRMFKGKWGFGSIEEFIKVITERNNLTIDEARKVIARNSLLMKIAFILA